MSDYSEIFASLDTPSIKMLYPSLYKILLREFQKNEGVPYDYGFVYEIWARNTSIVKIGKSNNPTRRLCEISPKLMYDLELIRVWRSPCMSRSEKLIHEFYHDYQMNGEWFDLGEITSDLLFQTPLEKLLDWATAKHVSAAYWWDLFFAYLHNNSEEANNFLSSYPEMHPENLGFLSTAWLEYVYATYTSLPYVFSKPKELSNVSAPRKYESFLKEA